MNIYICHWLRIITRLSGYVIENLTWSDFVYNFSITYPESLAMILSQ